MGKWTLGGDTEEVIALTPDGMVKRQICTVMMDTDEHPDGDGWVEDVANIRLIAASPDLLAVLSAPMWLVWSNEHAAWWGPNRCHYYTDVSAAGRYTLEEAMEISKVRIGSLKTRQTGSPGEMIQPAPEWIEARAAAIRKATGEPTPEPAANVREQRFEWVPLRDIRLGNVVKNNDMVFTVVEVATYPNDSFKVFIRRDGDDFTGYVASGGDAIIERLVKGEPK